MFSRDKGRVDEERMKKGMRKEEENITVWQQYTRDFLTVPCPVYFRGKCCKITVNTAFSRDLQVRHGNGEKKKKKRRCPVYSSSD